METLAAALLVALASSAGHELGIRLVAMVGPWLSAEEAGKVWHAFVARCQARVAAHGPLTPDDVAGLWQGTGGDGGPRGPG